MKKIGMIVLVSLIVISSVFIYLHTPSGKMKIARFIERYARENYGIRLQINSLDFSLLPLNTDFIGLRVYGGKQDHELFLAAKRVHLSLPFSTSWKGRIFANEVLVDDLQINPGNLPHPRLPEDWAQRVQAKKLTFTGGLLKYSKVNITELEVHASAQPNRLNIQELSAEVDSLRIRASGVIGNWNAPAYRFHYRVNGALPRTLVGPHLSGVVLTAGDITGSKGKYVVLGTFSSKSLSILNSQPFPANATYEVKAGSGKIMGTLNTKPLGTVQTVASVNPQQIQGKASLPELSAEVEGKYDFSRDRFQFKGDFVNTSLKQLRPVLQDIPQDVSGNLTAHWTASGALRVLKDSRATLLIQEGSVQRKGMKADLQPGSNVKLANERFHLDIAARMKEGVIKVQGIVPVEQSQPVALHVTGNSDLRLVSLLTDRLTAEGPLNASIEIRGTRRAPVYKGEINAPHFSVTYPHAGLHVENGTGNLHFDSQLVVARTKGLLNDAPMEFHARFPVTNRPGEIHFRVASFSFSGFNHGLSGKIDAKLDAVGKGTNLTGWNGEAELNPSSIKLANQDLAISPFRAVLSKGIFRIDNFRAHAAGIIDASANGTINLNDGTLNGRIKSFTELSALPFISTARLGGKLFTDVSLHGPIQAPEYFGKISTQNMSIQSTEFLLPIENLYFDASLQKNELQIEQLKGSVGGGGLSASGAIHFDGWNIKDLDVTLNARNVAIAYPKETQVELDTSFHLGGDRINPVVTGKVLVRRAIVSLDIDNTLRAIRTALAEKQTLIDTPKQNQGIRLDIGITNDEPVVISNNLGNILTGLDLKISGNSGRPRLGGKLDLVEGSQLYLQTRTFVVDRGNIYLEGGEKIRPILDLALSSTIQDDETKRSYKIRLPLRGPIDDLKDDDPESIPYLPPQQIYFLLLTGRAEAQLTRAESQFMRQELLDYYSGMEVLPVPEKIAQGVVLNKARTNPEMISSERNSAGELVQGKDFFSGVSLVYAHPLQKSSEQIWIADYKLRKDIAVRFIDQEDGTISSNVRHMLRFGKGSSATASIPARIAKSTTIGRVDIQNESSMPDNELQAIVDLHPGDAYGELFVKERIGEIKQALQEYGHLYPSIAVNRKSTSGKMDLQFVVSGNGKRSLNFEGYQPDEERIRQYNEWWREGFSETSVLGLIEQDLLRELWKSGYHLAQLQQKTQSNDETLTYQFHVSPGTQFTTPALDFIGAHELKDLESEIEKLYSSREEMLAEAIHEFASFRQKVETVYIQHGFLGFQVESHEQQFDSSKSTCVTRIRMHEGTQSRITEVRVSGGPQFPPGLQEKLKLKPGAIYHAPALTEDQMNIGRHYEDLGYYKFRIKSRMHTETDGAGVILTHHMELGDLAKIGSIGISGNNITDPKIIRKHGRLQENDVLTLTKLAAAQKNLNDLGIFQDVKIQAQETAIPGRYDVRIHVQESKNYELTYAAGYNNEKKLEGTVQLSDVNLFGTGQTLSFIAKLNSEDRIYRAIYHSPALSGVRWKTLIEGSFEKLEQPLLLTETAAIEFQRQRKISDSLFLIGDYRFARVEVAEKTPTDIFYVGEEPVNISRVSGTLLIDTRNDPIAPTRGRLISSQISYAPRFLGSQTAFVRNYSQAFNYHTFGNKVWVTAVRFGIANPSEEDLIATERFFAGGSFSVRGFERDQLGPRDPELQRPMGGEAVLIINQELRFPLVGSPGTELEFAL